MHQMQEIAISKHIGIVGCSAEGAALCYRTICAEAAARTGSHAHPEITMHTPSLADYVHALEKRDLNEVAELMLASADILAKAGVDFLICPDNTIHQAFDRVEAHSPLPWLHIAEVTATAAKRRRCNRIALFGTASLVRSDLYPRVLEAHGIEVVRPTETVIKEVDRVIFQELVPGRVLSHSREMLRTAIQTMSDQGCDGVILGCTELPLIISPSDSALPVLDTTRLLAYAALETATSV